MIDFIMMHWWVFSIAATLAIAIMDEVVSSYGRGRPALRRALKFAIGVVGAVLARGVEIAAGPLKKKGGGNVK